MQDKGQTAKAFGFADAVIENHDHLSSFIETVAKSRMDPIVLIIKNSVCILDNWFAQGSLYEG